MGRKGTKKHKWTDAELVSEASRYSNRWEFQKNSGPAYKAAWRKGKEFLDRICSHMKDLHVYWTNEMLRSEALKYSNRGDFQKGSSSAYQIADSRGLLNKICSHMKYVVYPWTNEELQKEALKYLSRSEFELKNENAYSAACRRGKPFLDKICSHMTLLNRSWTNEELALEALKYMYVCDFRMGSSSAYALACRRGIIENICSHMELSKGSSGPELCLKKKISDVIGDSKKLRDRKVKIEGKPYIKGFDIDIYVPELNKGIEFDGTYYHSFKCMRKSKSKKLWSDEDICNYHEVKDEYFASKGIQILHIKEEDWISDKEACIKRCLEFLGVSNERQAA